MKGKFKVAFLVFCLALISSCNLDVESEKLIINISYPDGIISAPIYIAEEKGFFEKNNISLVAKDYGSSSLRVNALNHSEIDFAYITETSFIKSVLSGEASRIVAIVSKTGENLGILAWKNKGINSIADLKNKKIGLVKGLSAKFILNSMLVANNISLSEVEIALDDREEILNRFKNGELDALLYWEPNLSNFKKEYQEEITVLSANNYYQSYFALATNSVFSSKRTKCARLFLGSLKEAIDFMRSNQEETIKLIAKKYELSEMDAERYLKIYDFNLFLDQSLINLIEEEAKWVAEEENLPFDSGFNFLSFIDSQNLKGISPETVSIISGN